MQVRLLTVCASLLLVTTLGVATTARSQATQAGATAAAPPAADLQRAATAFAASSWAEANAQYSAIAKQFPQHALSRFRIGVTLTELGRSAEAESHLREGERLGIPAAQGAFRLAESLAEQAKFDAAVAELKRASDAGYLAPASAFEADVHFAKLKSHPQWRATIDVFDAILQPCKHDAHFREFDFWIGDWDVRPVGTSTGPASRNTITLEENSCVVMEHWQGLGGSTGQSFNLFDRSLGKWRQTWVDNVGGQHEYIGALVHGNMTFEGTTPAPQGKLGRIPTKLTLFHISRDSVRQFAQTSSDSGRTWTTSYDLLYVRRKP